MDNKTLPPIDLNAEAKVIATKEPVDNVVRVSLNVFRQRDAYVRAIRRKAERHLTEMENAVLWAAATEAIPEPNIIFNP